MNEASRWRQSRPSVAARLSRLLVGVLLQFTMFAGSRQTMTTSRLWPFRRQSRQRCFDFVVLQLCVLSKPVRNFLVLRLSVWNIYAMGTRTEKRQLSCLVQLGPYLVTVFILGCDCDYVFLRHRLPPRVVSSHLPYDAGNGIQPLPQSFALGLSRLFTTPSRRWSSRTISSSSFNVYSTGSDPSTSFTIPRLTRSVMCVQTGD